jgi:hypothetical protein
MLDVLKANPQVGFPLDRNNRLKGHVVRSSPPTPWRCARPPGRLRETNTDEPMKQQVTDSNYSRNRIQSTSGGHGRKVG